MSMDNNHSETEQVISRPRLTQGQLKFLKAIRDAKGGVFHRLVVDPVVKAGLAFPCAGNFSFFIIGCNGHSASRFFLTDEGRKFFEAA